LSQTGEGNFGNIGSGLGIMMGEEEFLPGKFFQ